MQSGSRNVDINTWAFGRVNSFVTGDGGARKADADILARANKRIKNKKRSNNETNYQTKNTLAKHQKAHGHTKAHMEYMKTQNERGHEFHRCS